MKNSIKFDRTRLLGAAVVALMLAGGTGAFAAGGGGGGGGGGSSSNPSCSNGKVWDAGKKMCVPANRMDDGALIEHGRNLALNGDYNKALEVLGAVRNQENDVALTYIG